MNETEIIKLLSKLQDVRDEIYLLGNIKTAKTKLENIIKELTIKVNDIDIDTNKAVDKHCVGSIKNSIDLAYLTGVFNVVGIDGLSKEIARLKKIGKNPHEIFLVDNYFQ